MVRAGPAAAVAELLVQRPQVLLQVKVEGVHLGGLLLAAAGALVGGEQVVESDALRVEVSVNDDGCSLGTKLLTDNGQMPS